MEMTNLDRQRAAEIGPGQSGKDLPDSRLIPKATKAKKKVGAWQIKLTTSFGTFANPRLLGVGWLMLTMCSALGLDERQ
jgi:hypothetical protein